MNELTLMQINIGEDGRNFLGWRYSFEHYSATFVVFSLTYLSNDPCTFHGTFWLPRSQLSPCLTQNRCILNSATAKLSMRHHRRRGRYHRRLFMQNIEKRERKLRWWQLPVCFLPIPSILLTSHRRSMASLWNQTCPADSFGFFIQILGMEIFGTWGVDLKEWTPCSFLLLRIFIL